MSINMRPLSKLRRVPENDSVFLIVRFFRRRLLKLVTKRVLIHCGAPVGGKIFVRFDSTSALKKFLRRLQLFEKFRRVRLSPKRRAISSRVPGPFKSDPLEERAVAKDESTPVTKRRGKRYKFRPVEKGLTPYAAALIRRTRRQLSKTYYVVGMVSPRLGLLAPSLVYQIAFCRARVPKLVSNLCCRGVFSNISHLFIVLNSIFLLIWMSRLAHISALKHANYSSSSF